jgi:pSer/pThr/pTyr-binding forkhead associated (FHA) protein
MEQSFGKLVVIQQDAPGREFELGKASVTLGRSMTNDIILSDARVSRGHSRLECSAASCTIVDLGSANGTRVNGLPVDRVELKNGDTIAVGNTQLRYDVSKPFEEVGMTVIDTSADLDLTLDREILPMSINETHSPRLIIFTSGRTWEVPIEDSDRLAIGRTEDNQVVIEHESVSRHHAEVVRRGSAFLVRDLGSTNGVWLRGERVEESALQDGDVVRVGHAQLVFKKGFGI